MSAIDPHDLADVFRYPFFQSEGVAGHYHRRKEIHMAAKKPKNKKKKARKQVK